MTIIERCNDAPPCHCEARPPFVIARHVGAEAISCYNGAMTGKAEGGK